MLCQAAEHFAYLGVSSMELDFHKLKNPYAIDTRALEGRKIQFPTGSPRKPIYHYTSIGGLSGILENKTLRFTNIRYMNDKDEVTAGIDALFQQGNFNEIDTSAMRCAMTGEADQAFVCCFSSGGDLLPLWNYYTKEINNQGYNLEFDYKTLLIDILKKNPELNGCDISFGKVEYCKNDTSNYGINWTDNVVSSMEAAMAQLFLSLLQYMNKSALDENSDGIAALRNTIEKANNVDSNDKPMVFHYNGDNCRFVRGLPNNFYCFIKRHCFKAEEEFRVVISVPKAVLPRLKESGMFKYRISSGLLIPYLDVKFSESAVKGITISPTIQSDLAERSIQEFLSYCDFHVNDISKFLRKSNVPVRF